MKKNRLTKLLTISLIVVVLCTMLIVPLGVNAWNQGEYTPVNAIISSCYTFDFSSILSQPDEFYAYVNTNGVGYYTYDLGTLYSDDYSSFQIYGYVPLNGLNPIITPFTGYQSYKYAYDIDVVTDITHSFVADALDFEYSYDGYAWNDIGIASNSEIDEEDNHLITSNYYDSELGYLYLPFIVTGNIELGVEVSNNNYVYLNKWNAKLSAITCNYLFGCNQLTIDCFYSDDVNTYIIVSAIPIWASSNNLAGEEFYDYYYYDDFTSFAANGYSTADTFLTSLEEARDKGVEIGASQSYGENVLGDALEAPIDALNNFVLFEVGDVSVTLGGVVGCVIALTLFIIFLKMFAGG